jgi:hypothetical protein
MTSGRFGQVPGTASKSARLNRKDRLKASADLFSVVRGSCEDCVAGDGHDHSGADAPGVEVVR